MSAADRITEFVRQWELRAKMSDYNPNVYSVHFDPEAESATLAIADIKELLEDVEELQARVRLARSYHGNSIDPTECMECEDESMPCRTSRALDGTEVASR